MEQTLDFTASIRETPPMDETKKQALEFNKKMFTIMKTFVENKPLQPLLFRSILSQQEESYNPAIMWSHDEFVWLQYNFDFLKKIIENKVPSCIIWLLNEKKTSLTNRNVAVMMGVYDNTVLHWSRKLMSSELIIPKPSHVDRKEKRFTINLKLRNISENLNRLIIIKYGEDKLGIMTSKNIDKVRKKAMVRMRKHRNSRKHRYF